MTIQRAKYNSITLAKGLKREGRGELWMEKMDGVWATLETAFGTLAGEQMNDGSFWAFDCLSLGPKDIRHWSFHERFFHLHTFKQIGIKIVATGIGAEFLEAVLAHGGEGVVIADLDAPYGIGLTKCKRMATWDLLVTEKHPMKASIHLGSLDGEDYGWCPCRADYDRICVGDIVEVDAFGRHNSGKLREPRFIRLRHYKSSPLI